MGMIDNDDQKRCYIMSVIIVNRDLFKLSVLRLIGQLGRVLIFESNMVLVFEQFINIMERDS